jgi:hypothetical protein
MRATNKAFMLATLMIFWASAQSVAQIDNTFRSSPTRPAIAGEAMSDASKSALGRDFNYCRSLLQNLDARGIFGMANSAQNAIDLNDISSLCRTNFPGAFR